MIRHDVARARLAILLILLSLTVSTAAAAGDPIFATASSYDSGGKTAASAASGDFNNDGKLDVAIANQCIRSADCASGSVSVLLGNGNGTFQAAVSYSSGGQAARAVAVADVNRDGNLDLVATNECISSADCTTGSVSVLLGNGNGTFQAALSYASGGVTALSVAVGNFNADDEPDLAVVNACNSNDCTSGTVGVLLGNGDGTYQVVTSYASGGKSPSSVAAADLNGDGKPDLAVTNQCINNADCTSGSVSVLLGNGGGAYQAAVSYVSGGVFPFAVVAGDFNGDGKLDLAAANECTDDICANGSVGVLLGNGDGTYQTAVNYGSGGKDALSVAAADFNGDGKLDLAVTNQCPGCANGSVGVLLGNGDGTFPAAVDYPTRGQSSDFAAVGDINNDGKPDLIVANECADNFCTSGSADILLNIATGFHHKTSTAVVSSANPGGIGQQVTFTATVTPTFNAGALTGDVTFYDGANALAAVAVSGGQAAFSTSSLALGTHTITAGYGGDGTYLPSTSAAITETIRRSDTTTALGSSLNPSSYGQSVTFTANVSSLSGTPTGTVTFTDGAATLGTVTLNNGAAALSVSTLGVGSHSVTATYNGDGTFTSSSSSALQQTVNQSASTLALASGTNPSAFNQPVTFTATITPVNGGTAAGTVTFTDGANALGTITVSGNTATLITSTLGLGTHSITSSYSGDTNVSGNSSSTLSQMVNTASTTTTVASSQNPSLNTQTVTFTATATGAYGGTPTGSVTFKQGTTTIGTVTLVNGQASVNQTYNTATTVSITAMYSGDTRYLTSTSAALSQVVQKATSTTTTVSNLNPSNYGQAVTFTATVTSAIGAPANGEIITFKQLVSGVEKILGTAPISGGSASFTISSLAGGTDSVKAAYMGNGKIIASHSSFVSQVVNKTSSTTAVVSSLNPAVYGQTIIFTATVNGSGPAKPTGKVTFKNGSTVIATSTLSNGIATFTTSTMQGGNKSITAAYGGDSSYASSTSTVLSQVVNRAATTTLVSSSLNPSNLGQAVTFTATVSSATGPVPTGTVTFKDGTTVIGTGTLSGGVATLTTSTVSQGTRSITAVYATTTNFTSSTGALSQIVN